MATPEMIWQPIETAPKDGTEIVASFGRQARVKQLVNFNRIHGYWESKGEPQLGLETNATHWLKLPQSPKVTD